MPSKIYLDYAATTPVDKRVLEAMEPYFSEKYGNTMSLHSFGREAKEKLEESRENIAKFMNTQKNEIIFTSGATESNNFALKGIAFANKNRGKHIITTQIEHHAILNPCKWLEKQGFEVTYLKVDENGLVNPKDVGDAIREDTILVSIIYANNEIGTIQPLEEIGQICKEKGVYFHTDATQIFGKLPIDVNKLNLDLMTINAHKLYGPKGVGALFIREGTKIEPLLHGGGHENNLRSTTINLPGIVGFSKAVDIAKKEMEKDAEEQTKLRDYIIKRVLEIPNSRLNGHPTKRLPNNTNFSFDFIEGESLVLLLDDKGIACSTGSACSSPNLEPSHVLLALGLRPEQAHGSLRATIGKYTTKEEIDYFLEVLPEVVESLRKLSPLR